MSSLLPDVALAILATLLSWVLVGLYTRAMTAARRVEAPNERSMHRVPVPAGAGLAVVATTVVLWTVWEWSAVREQAVVLVAFAALAVMSWLDDRHQLSPVVRIALHALAVTVCLATLASDARILPALPLAVERILLGVAWLWFINLFNFMDGLDGLAGSEAIAIALGYLLMLLYVGAGGPQARLALILATATLGYLAWNWHPAKVFMGDAGSIPLGFVLGWLMIDLALRGYWAAAGILPLYFAVDASITLVRGLLAGRKPWQPHRQHFYQRAVLGGATPPGVVWRVIAANCAFIALALLSASYPIVAIVGAAMVVTALIWELARLAACRQSSPPA